MHTKEQVLASYSIRIPDIDKHPFDEKGYIDLPITEQIDIKKMGLKPIESSEHKVKR